MSNSNPNADVLVRPANADDIEALNTFIQPFVKVNRLLPRTIEELHDLVKTGFVAEHNELIVGFVALEIYSSKLSEVRSLAVSPLYQRKGVGQRLVAACVKLATERKIREVMAITSSEDFFQTCGFDFTLPGEKKALFLATEE